MEEKNICKNCNSVNINNFCSDCGQKIYKKRFTINSFLMFLSDALDIEKGFFYTIKILFIKPEKVINDYLKGITKPYFNPLKYLLVIGGIYTFLVLWFKVFDNNFDYMESQNNNEELYQFQTQWFNFYKKIMNFIPILIIPFVSIATKWFYKSKKLFYGEHLIINSFLFVQILLITTLLIPAVLIFSPTLMYYFPIITISYSCYFFYNVFQNSLIRSILLTFLSIVTGYFLFIIFLVIIMFIAAIVIIKL